MYFGINDMGFVFFTSVSSEQVWDSEWCTSYEEDDREMYDMPRQKEGEKSYQHLCRWSVGACPC